jgi:hypothetical protein
MPTVKQVHGMARCDFCNVAFERRREWSRFCSKYCRGALWNLTKRRKMTEKGYVEVEINGKRRIFMQEAR